MMDLDLDIVNKKVDTIKLGGEEYKFKDIPMEEHFYNEFLLQELDKILLNSKQNVKKAAKIMVEYIMGIMDVPEEVAAKVSMSQLRMIRKHLERKEMYDQGFNDKEIDEIEKKALKKQLAQIG
jgi:hypothetical protein